MVEASTDGSTADEGLTVEQLSEACLTLVQELSANGAITEEERDNLKGKCFSWLCV